MKQKVILALIFAIAMFFAISETADATALQVRIANGEEVEIDGSSLKDGSIIAVDRDSTIDITIPIEAIPTDNDKTDTIDDVTVKATLRLPDDDDIEAERDSIDILEGARYTRTLELEIPDDIERGTYTLSITLSDPNDIDIVRRFFLLIEAPKDEIVIRDVIFNPEPNVQAGRVLLTTVKLKNTGRRDQDDVKVRVSIPELGISVSDFLDEIESDRSSTSQEVFLRIPNCAKEGTYDVVVEAEYDDGDETVKEDYELTIVPSGSCSINPIVGGKDITLSVDSPVKRANPGEQVFYRLTLNNDAATARTFVFSSAASGIDVSRVAFDPSNIVTIGARQSLEVIAVADINKNAIDGTQAFVVTVEDSSSVHVEEITLSAVISSLDGRGAGNGNNDDAVPRRALEVGLIVLIILVVLAGVFVALRRVRGTGESGSEETYY